MRRVRYILPPLRPSFSLAPFFVRGGGQKEEGQEEKKNERESALCVVSKLFHSITKTEVNFSRVLSNVAFFSSRRRHIFLFLFREQRNLFYQQRVCLPSLATISSRDETCLPRYTLLATRCLLLRQIKRRR